MAITSGMSGGIVDPTYQYQSSTGTSQPSSTTPYSPTLPNGITSGYTGSGELLYYYKGQPYTTLQHAQDAAKAYSGTMVNGGDSITNQGGTPDESGGGTLGGSYSGGTGGGGTSGTVYTMGPDGKLITQSAYEREQQMQLAAKLQADAEARRLASFSSFVGTQPVVQRTGVSPDETAARAAAFARAKDTAGQTAVASLKTLQDVMANNGLMGSSVEAGGIANLLDGAQGGVNDMTREQYIQELAREQQIQDSNFNAQVTQRGQTLSALPSLLGLITSQSGASNLSY